MFAVIGGRSVVAVALVFVPLLIPGAGRLAWTTAHRRRRRTGTRAHRGKLSPICCPGGWPLLLWGQYFNCSHNYWDRQCSILHGLWPPYYPYLFILTPHHFLSTSCSARADGEGKNLRPRCGPTAPKATSQGSQGHIFQSRLWTPKASRGLVPGSNSIGELSCPILWNGVTSSKEWEKLVPTHSLLLDPCTSVHLFLTVELWGNPPLQTHLLLTAKSPSQNALSERKQAGASLSKNIWVLQEV